MQDPDATILFVHAHPDDETISTGGTIAAMVRDGARITVLTCTRGERGEVIPDALRSLEGDGPALAAHREGELAEAMRILGVRDQRFLGDRGARAAGLSPRRYLDSGMQWGDDGLARPLDDVEPEAFCSAPLAEAVDDIAAVIEGLRPDAVVSYDANGGYGHPDHVRAHEAAREAAERAGVPFFEIVPPGAERFGGDLVLDTSEELPTVAAAMRAHATQITVDGSTFALSSGPARPIATSEAFRAYAVPATPPGPPSRLSRVIAGITAGVVGVALGIVFTIHHQQGVMLGEFRLPWGVIVTLLSFALVLVGLRVVLDRRYEAICFAVAVNLAVFVLSQRGPGGSVLIPANEAGIAWAYGPVLIAAVVLAWPRIRPRSER